MNRNLAALASGTLFGAGLAVSRMTNPAKVIGFLDVAGDWDPSLAFVMGVAVIVSAVSIRLRDRLHGNPSSSAGALPATAIDARLVCGAATFGVGWGLAGFCPGPALAALTTGSGEVVLFVFSMTAGMAVFEFGDRLLAHRSEPRTHPHVA